MSFALAFAAGAVGAVAVADAIAAFAAPLRRRLPRAARAAGALAETLGRAGREGRDPGARERRRLLVSAGLVALALGTLLAGPLAGAAVATAGPWATGRLLRSRRERYRRNVEAAAPAMAVALADALRAGHSLRGAVTIAAEGVPGAGGHELRRVAAELSLGAELEEALEEMRRRCRSHPIDVVVGACLLQRRAGGDLGRLLRDSARAFEDHARLQGEVRAATAQARFTGLLVTGLPLGAAALAELASPGYLAGLAGSFLTAWLLGLAVAMQVVAAVAIRRLARVSA